MDCMVMDDVFYCSFCFQPNPIFVDPSGGDFQAYVEDCQVCCRPNQLSIQWLEDEEGYHIESQPES